MQFRQPNSGGPQPRRPRDPQTAGRSARGRERSCSCFHVCFQHQLDLDMQASHIQKKSPIRLDHPFPTPNSSHLHRENQLRQDRYPYSLTKPAILLIDSKSSNSPFCLKQSILRVYSDLINSSLCNSNQSNRLNNHHKPALLSNPTLTFSRPHEVKFDFFPDNSI